MTKQDILNHCGLRIGDTNATFLSQTLSPAFDMVLLELGQDDCISLLNTETAFTFNAAGCVASNGVLDITMNHASILNLATGRYPERIYRLLVPAWGVEGRLRKVSHREFEDLWLPQGTTYTGRPRVWRIHPDMNHVQVWPVPDSESATATCLLHWMAAPSILADSADIVEVSLVDLPTILAGLYRVGIKFQDETIRDATMAEALWQQGKQAMRARIARQQYSGRAVQIKYREV